MSTHEQTRKRWQALVARFERSGASQAAFAAEMGVGLPAFQYWLYKLRAEAGGRAAGRPGRSRDSARKQGEVRLVPVEVRRAPTDNTGIEVDVSSLRLRLTGSVDPGYVALVVGALREIGQC